MSIPTALPTDDDDLDRPSVSHWLGEVKERADGEAVRKLWDRYFDRLAQLAQKRFKSRRQGPSDGEDVALSAFNSFVRGAAEGKFEMIADRDDLWRMLSTITTRKAANERRREDQIKRGGGRVLDQAAFAGAQAQEDANPFAEVAGKAATPPEIAAVAEEIRNLFGALPSASDRLVALLRMEGYSNEDVANTINASVRTVERKLKLIRKTWLEKSPD